MSTNEKRINSRVILKHDTEANWLQAINFRPLVGELIIYDPDETYPFMRYKRGRVQLFTNEETGEYETRVDENGNVITTLVNELAFEPFIHIGDEESLNQIFPNEVPVGMLWLDTSTAAKQVYAEGVEF